ncbi:uncharacterized protein F5891DRAFT_1132717 [Suillus fuscotomentosus]|uniref:Uncharacterized protein n=1 Tax=Suillus fuscotomentosus TaxID=1912939 RepID=A0AAD4DND4_9AGAM|nr:uncharacterized protein F5891DRAFT_1132717 [Suillus fuscotomentosus]KAG1885887.1 hypothetical protein F5891DRAFT_1132717 [Suillus fuscotomentosus]
MNCQKPSSTAVFMDASQPSLQTPSCRRRSAVPLRPKGQKNVDQHQVKEALSASSYYFFDVIIRAMRLLRIPLSVLLFLWMLAFTMMRISSTLHTAFSPMCFLPLVSRSVLCTQLKADFPHLMQYQSLMFEQILDGSAGGSGLSLEIRKAEFATADLATLVRNSNLLKSNDALADLLATFVRDAKMTARSLTKLSSKVASAVDNIMAVNHYAMRTVEDADKNAASPYSITALAPFRTAPTMQDVIMDAFSSAMEAFSRAIQRLILEAEIYLSAIREAVIREDAFITAEKSLLLEALWTKLGGNRRTLRGYEQHANLLMDVNDYRKQAQVHIMAVLQILYLMSEDMEDLRERAAAPELVDERIPIQVHIQSIQSGLQRLQEGRVRAKEKEEDVMRKALGFAADYSF